MHDFQIHIGEQSRKEKAVLKSEEHSLLVWAEKPTEQKIPPRKLCSHQELIKMVFWKCVYGLWVSSVTPGDSQAQSFFKLLKLLLQARAELAPCFRIPNLTTGNHQEQCAVSEDKHGNPAGKIKPKNQQNQTKSNLPQIIEK